MEASPGVAPGPAHWRHSSTPVLVVLCPHLVEAGMAREAKKALEGTRYVGLVATEGEGEVEVETTVRSLDVCRNPSSLTRITPAPAGALVVAACNLAHDPSELRRVATKITADPHRG